MNTDPYNLISDHARTQDGHAAWKKLKSHYEGENYVEKIRNAALDKLKLTTYKGDSKTFKFEHYLNVHIKAHKRLFSVGYNNGLGLDDATKIHYFKANITPAADLDTALSMARPYESKTFQEYATYLVTEVDFKNNRKRQAMVHDRKVSKVTARDDKKKRKPSNLGPVISETVDGKKIESKRYSRDEFCSMTENQRNAVIRLNRQRRNKSQHPQKDVKGVSIDDLRNEIGDEVATICDAVISAVQHKDQVDKLPADDITTITADTAPASKATAGSIGEFLAAAREKRNK